MIALDVKPASTAGRRDPTRSGSLRREGRSLVNQRVYYLHKQLRQTLQDYDLLSLRQDDRLPPGFQRLTEPNAQRLDRSERFLRQLVDSALTQPPEWLRDVITRAVQRGVEQAGRELRVAIERLDFQPVGQFHSKAAGFETIGIAGETQRRILRHVATALEVKLSPNQLMREIRKSLEHVTRYRLILLVNTVVVRAVNAGKLLTYRNNDVLQVGIEPEWLPRQFRRDSFIRDEDMVNVLTAGDDDVCDECEDIAAAGPYALDDAEGMIPAHPNCRCAFTPADDLRYAKTEEREERLAEERSARRSGWRRDEDEED